MAEFRYVEPFPTAKEETPYRKVPSDLVSVAPFEGQEVLKVAPEALTLVAREAFRDVSFLYRPGHLAQLAAILDDPEASENDRGVALALLRNAEVASGFVLPMCQDTGTATIVGKKGQRVWTGGRDAEHLSRGIFETYAKENLRYSQTVPLTMYDEANSGTNLPAQIDLYATDGMEYHFLMIAKGGGSANKTYLFQETKALLNPTSLVKYLTEKMKTLGTAACPPYHLAFVIGGTSAEACLKTVKLASAKALDGLPTAGSKQGQAFRDVELEAQLLEAARKTGIGAQFGGKYFALDVRVVRLPRHGASCPIGMGVSCSADRNILAKIDRDGIWVEELERNPGRFIPERYRGVPYRPKVAIDLNRPMTEIRAELSRHPVATMVSLTGTIVVARDIAHAKLKERLDRGEGLPQYFKDHPVYYAGPAKTPEGLPVRLVRADDRRPHGLVRGPLPVAGRVDGHDRQGQPQRPGDRGLPEARRLLPGLRRRPGRPPREGEHPEGRAHRVPGARDGGRLPARGRGLPGRHPRGRQGQRLLPPARVRGVRTP